MYFDAFEGLSEEYRNYRVIQPEQLNFRQPADDRERFAASSLNNTVSKDAIKLFIIGGIMIALGVVVMFFSIGGIGLILFGVLPIVFGVVKKNQSNSSNLVATGTLLKKESQRAGSVKNRSRRTFYWFVIEVDDMTDTLCIVHGDPETFDEARVGDKILVTNDNLGYFGKKML